MAVFLNRHKAKIVGKAEKSSVLRCVNVTELSDGLEKLASMTEELAAAFLRVRSVFLDCIDPEVGGLKLSKASARNVSLHGV
jgi:hypothetical protein